MLHVTVPHQLKYTPNHRKILTQPLTITHVNQNLIVFTLQILKVSGFYTFILYILRFNIIKNSDHKKVPSDTYFIFLCKVFVMTCQRMAYGRPIHLVYRSREPTEVK
jgi:hypothetical protein